MNIFSRWKILWNLQEAQRELAAERASSEKAWERRVWSAVSLDMFWHFDLSFVIWADSSRQFKGNCWKKRCLAIRCRTKKAGTTRTQPTKRRVLHPDSELWIEAAVISSGWMWVERSGTHEIWLPFDSWHIRWDMALLYSVQICPRLQTEASLRSRQVEQHNATREQAHVQGGAKSGRGCEWKDRNSEATFCWCIFRCYLNKNWFGKKTNQLASGFAQLFLQATLCQQSHFLVIGLGPNRQIGSVGFVGKQRMAQQGLGVAYSQSNPPCQRLSALSAGSFKAALF